MTRKELITTCVDNQIEGSIVKAQNRTNQIRYPLKDGAGLKAMSLSQCQSWCNSVFNV